MQCYLLFLQVPKPHQSVVLNLITECIADEIIPEVWLTSSVVEVMISVEVSVLGPVDGVPTETVVALGVLLPVDDPVVTIVGAVVGV